LKTVNEWETNKRIKRYGEQFRVFVGKIRGWFYN
jgi:hypothetical protein